MSSKAYVDLVVPEIVGAWSARSLIRDASAELNQQAAGDQIVEAFPMFSAIGNPVNTLYSVRVYGCRSV